MDVTCVCRCALVGQAARRLGARAVDRRYVLRTYAAFHWQRVLDTVVDHAFPDVVVMPLTAVVGLIVLVVVIVVGGVGYLIDGADDTAETPLANHEPLGANDRS